MEQDEGGGGDRADPPGAETDPAQRLERDLQQRVAALGQCPGGGVQGVDGALIVAQRPAGGLLDRRGEGGLLALVAQVAENGVGLVGPFGQAGSTSACARRQVVSCSRPGRTGEVQIGQPSGVVRTWTLPPWAACLPDHHKSTRACERPRRTVGPGAEQRSVRISVPSTCTWECPAARAASNAPRSPGAAAARASMPSWRYR